MKKKLLSNEMNQLSLVLEDAFAIPAEESSLLAQRAHINFKLKKYKDALIDADLSLIRSQNKDPAAHYVKAAALFKLYGNILEVIDHSKLFLKTSLVNAKCCNDARKWIETVQSNIQRWSIGRLPDEILIKIFHYLPFRDRMRAEIVCKRWNFLLKKYGWSNFRYFVPQLVGHCYMGVQDYKAKCLPIFKRCAPYLYGLSLAQFGMCSSLLTRLLPLLKNLQHLNLEFIEVSSSSLMSIAKALPNLKSVAFSDFDINVAHGLQFFMATCTKIELLCLHGDSEFFDFEFSVLPPSLKCLDVYSFVPYHNILRQAAIQEIKLEALVVRCAEESVIPVVPESFFVSSLKYLEIEVYALSAQNFVSALSDLSNLCALDLEVGHDVNDQLTTQIVNGIAMSCQGLQHLSIKFLKTQYDITLFDELAEKLLNIRSLTITGDFENNMLAYLFESHVDRVNSVLCLLDKICSHGKLERFYTDAIIPLDHLFTIISKCKKLADVNIGYYSYDTENESGKIAAFLSAHEDRFLKTINRTPFNVHTENPIREQFRTGCLSAGKPRFFL